MKRYAPGKSLPVFIIAEYKKYMKTDLGKGIRYG